MEIEICYEDAFIIAVNKPCNILVHHSYMARNMDAELTLLDLLEEQLSHKFFPLHRLDRKTSGLILLAKNRKDVSSFQDLFIQNKIEKTYYAIVRGHASDSGIIDSPVKGRDSNVYKEASTRFKKLNQITLEIPVHPYPNSRYSLLELKPKTGRLHQLRIHLNKINHPIIGDPKYGDRFHNRMYSSNFNCSNMFLHALTLEFKHPITGHITFVKSILPVHWAKIPIN
tara:strand:+ start:556 stop:1236 length:681 start_codon:yes stop_codon:yes gene_type:complete